MLHLKENSNSIFQLFFGFIFILVMLFASCTTGMQSEVEDEELESYRSLYELGVEDFENGHLELAQLRFDDALIGAKDNQDNATLALIYEKYFMIHFYESKFGESMLDAKKSLEYFRKEKNFRGVSFAYSNIASAYLKMDDLDQSMRHFQLGLDIATREGMDEIRKQFHNNFGVLYANIGELEAAISHFRKAIQLDIEFNNGSDHANELLNIGELFFELEIYDSSLIYLSQANDEFKNQNTGYVDKLGLFNCQILKLSNYNRQGKSNEIQELMSALLDSSTTIKDDLAISGSQLAIGISHISLGNRKKGIDQISATLFGPSMESISLPEKIKLYEQVIYSLEQEGLFEELANRYKELTILKDLFNSRRYKERALEIEKMYNTEKKETEIKRLAQESESRASAMLHLIIIFSLTLLVIAIIIVAKLKLVKRRKIINESQKEILQLRLESTQVELHENKNKLRLHVDIIRKNNNMIIELNKKLNRSLDLEENEILLNQLKSFKILTKEDWKEFKLIFSKAHPNFIQEISEKFESITPAELRLMVLTALNFDQEECAGVLGVSLSTIKKTRYRLRKKLPIKSNERLTTYITNLMEPVDE